MKKTVIILNLLALLAFGCEQTTKKQAEIVNNEINIEQNEEYQDIEATAQDLDITTTIKFPDFSITINRLSVLNNEDEMQIFYDELDELDRDTVYRVIELGETIEGQVLFIKTSELTDIKVAQRYETSITIMGEGPHCDLINWKHYDSEWKQLKKNEADAFVCETYEHADLEKFPEIDIDELKEAVKAHCSERWYELIKDINSPTEYPSGVGISRYFLKVTGVRKQDKQIVEKIIVLENPMGC